jgi:hypothetical protein
MTTIRHPVSMPPTAGQDWNDVLISRRIAGSAQ